MARRLSHWFAATSTLLSVAAVIYFLRFATYSPGRSVLDVNGTAALIPMLLPLLFAIVGFAFARRGSAWGLWNVALLLLMFVIISGFSIGLAYLPSAVVMFLAAGLATAAKVVAA